MNTPSPAHSRRPTTQSRWSDRLAFGLCRRLGRQTSSNDMTGAISGLLFVAVTSLALLSGCSSGNNDQAETGPSAPDRVILSPATGFVPVSDGDRLSALTVDTRYRYRTTPATGDRSVAVISGEAELFRTQ
ncbi:MAG: hypothetical protein ACK4IT_08800 [Thioalkalivibrionaceae bacterium]